jgi:hypothetical protein
MPSNCVTIVGLVALLYALGVAHVAAEETTPLQVQTYGGIPYISGGLGQEELEALRQTSRDYNLKLIFALKDGSFVAEVEVVITDSTGKKVLEAVSHGPWFFTKLPAGKYRVSAQVMGQTRQQTAQVGQQKQTQLQFYW